MPTFIPKGMDHGKNSITYWLPVLNKNKIRSPRTIIVHGNVDYPPYLMNQKYFDDPEFKSLIDRVAHAAHLIGYPCFLRSGQTSDKHNWSETCFLKKQEDIPQQLVNIAEHSVMADPSGNFPPCDFWAVREMIPTTPIFHAFEGMPIVSERRFFVKEGKIICHHPYWPEEAFEYQDIESALIDKVNEFSKEDEKKLKPIVELIGEKIGGYWSVDMLKDSSGQWWCTDMAVGDDSYHWKGCKNEKSSK